MDALTALRQAIIAGREGEIKEDGSDLIIDGVRYAGDTPTAFRQSRVTQPYPLLAVWLQWKLKNVSVQELIKVATAAKTKFVLITDKNTLIDYLRGKSEAADYIDASKLGMAVPVAAGGEGGRTAASDENATLDAALRKELPYRTRASILSLPSKNLRDVVFKHFQIKAADEAGAGAAAGAPSASRSAAAAGGTGVASSVASDAAGRKRPRPESGSGGAAAAAAAAGPGADPYGGWRGTPIIIVPATATSLINMYNAAEFLGEGQFVPPAEARAAKGAAPKPTKITIKRKDARGNTCQYYVVDSVDMLQRSDWIKVAAVFALGPEWQFKGWRWGRPEDRDPKTGALLKPDVTPTEIFERAQGFHVQYEGDALHENIPKWTVSILPISKTKRYTDASVAQKFWSVLDQYIWAKKPFLLPKGVSNVASSETPGYGGSATPAQAAGAGK